MLILSRLRKDATQCFGIETKGLKLMQRYPLESYLRLVRFFAHCDYGSIPQRTGKHKLHAMAVGIVLSEFVILADVFSHAHHIGYADVYRELLPALPHQSAGERFP